MSKRVFKFKFRSIYWCFNWNEGITLKFKIKL